MSKKRDRNKKNKEPHYPCSFFLLIFLSSSLRSLLYSSFISPLLLSSLSFPQNWQFLNSITHSNLYPLPLTQTIHPPTLTLFNSFNAPFTVTDEAQRYRMHRHRSLWLFSPASKLLVLCSLTGCACLSTGMCVCVCVLLSPYVMSYCCIELNGFE